MNLAIKPIDETNIQAVTELTIKAEQQSFIETVQQCLDEAKIVKEWRPVAIYVEDEVVGFAMYGSFGPSELTWIDRLLIDQKHQGKGYGKQAMKLLISRVFEEYNVNVIHLSIVPTNTFAYQFYTSIGFEDMNEIDPSNNERMFCFKRCGLMK